MKNSLFLIVFSLFSITSFTQNYERDTICGTDTIYVDHTSMKTGVSNQFKAFRCTKISKVGFRLDLGFNHYRYNNKTKNWLGNHNGPLVGLTLAWGNLNLGGKFKIATINTHTDLDFNGDQLSINTKLNPVKVDIDLGYSINLKHSISIEPFIAVTLHDFIVLDVEDLGNNYDINKLWAPMVGTTINKYFPLDDYRFVSIFIRYGYGLADFKKVNKDLGFGYSDLSLGIGLKGFRKRTFLKKL